MKTFVAKPLEVKRDWYVVDAEGKTLGRLAAEIASRLRGKHKPIYTPHAEKIGVTGAKRTDKMYYRVTGYVGNMKSASFEKMIERSPERVLEIAVKGMLPKGPLGRDMYRKLKVFAGTSHPHAAQQPIALDL